MIDVVPPADTPVSPPARGKFVVVEGPDGAGKTRLAYALTAAVGARHVPVHVSCEPTSGDIGRLIRRVLCKEVTFDRRATALLFAADRVDHVERGLRPLMDAGVHVISDRYIHSSVVYQSQFLDPAFVRAINAGAMRPDLTLMLSVSPAVARDRNKRLALKDELYDADDFQARICAAYADLPPLFDGEVRVTLDANGSADDVLEAALAHVWAVIP